jgi:hypothetical protein
MKTTLRITLTDSKLIKKVRSIPKQERGRILQRALKVYFATVGGREVCELFSKGPSTALGENKKKPSSREAIDGLRDILGDY